MNLREDVEAGLLACFAFHIVLLLFWLAINEIYLPYCCWWAWLSAVVRSGGAAFVRKFKSKLFGFYGQAADCRK